MKDKTILLSQRYALALGKHLKQGPKASLGPALGLGQQTVAAGLETLDLAKMHEQALAVLMPGCAARSRIGMTRRAANFFTEANIPIEETHCVARRAKVHLERLKETLDQRTEELASTHRQLKRGVVRRKVMEEALEKSGKHHKKCLEESLLLQKRLRKLTHRVLSAQEDERRNISLELQDEIAQTLLGINVRLLSLKQEARGNTKDLKKKIASTQRLVVKSARSVRKVAREFRNT